MKYLQVKNWERFQHYKNKDNPPPWIKLYSDLLTNYEFLQLSEQERYQLIGIWLLASKTRGRIPEDASYVARCIGTKRLDLRYFLSRGWLEEVYSDSRQPLALSEQSEEEHLYTAQTGVGEHSLVRLLSILHDADSQTEAVIRSFRPSDGDLEAAREAALGPNVKSRTKVAVSELKKRAELKEAA
jgi:hypothetical protein